MIGSISAYSASNVIHVRRMLDLALVLLRYPNAVELLFTCMPLATSESALKKVTCSNRGLNCKAEPANSIREVCVIVSSIVRSNWVYYHSANSFTSLYSKRTRPMKDVEFLVKMHTFADVLP